MMLEKNKNLIYFTLFNNFEYLELLKICINTIIRNCPVPNFDILFITEEVFVNEILSFTKQFKNTVHFNTDYNAENNMKASMNKLKIFNFKDIDKYEKVLFLDCDIFVMDNLNLLFNENWDTEKLSVYNNPDVPVFSFNSKFHGLKNIPDEKIADLFNKNILPFNAGHFAFINSKKMKKHFDNVIWLTQVWPGEYFYEQSFMNHYFALNEIVEYAVLKDKIKLVNLNSGIVDNSIFSTKFIVHFIGEVTSPAKKLKKIQDYYNATFSLL
jgi:hypothetical protein